MATSLTIRIPRSWAIPDPDAAVTDPAAARRPLRLLTMLLFGEVFLQRLAVPVGSAQVPLMLPGVLGGAAVLLARGDLVADMGRTQAYLVAMAACVSSALVVFTRGLDGNSLTSLLLLVVTYAPFCCRLRADTSVALFPRLLDRFAVMTAVLAGFAVAQFGLQLLGWHYSDIIGGIVPPELIMRNFNTSYPVAYGSSLYKANAFVCLEPSFCSQFLAIGLVVSILRGVRRWRLPLLVVAILTTVSGTGVILLAAALVLLAVHKGPRFAATAVAGLALVVTAVSFTPAADVFAERATETATSSSSGSLRFVQPYTRTYDRLGGDPLTVLFGSGPGWSDRDADEFMHSTGLPLNYAMLPKLVLEYGLVGGAAFLVLIVWAFVCGSPSFVLSGALLVFYMVLSSSLLSPVVVYLGLLLLTWYARDTWYVPQRGLGGSSV
ncbi:MULTISPECIES: hypothetical protein [unclassified Frankia]|uniref:hypothetical protein n=2 Tax=Frankia TaxID=1854 RepID=UPI001EF5980E|nr:MULTISPECIES: hypothetical protein [unclassified Frankia]